MKKVILIVFILMLGISGTAFAADTDIDVKINSLFAAYKVDEVFNT